MTKINESDAEPAPKKETKATKETKAAKEKKTATKPVAAKKVKVEIDAEDDFEEFSPAKKK